VSPQEAAERLGVCRETIYRLCARGEVPFLRIGFALRLAMADVVAALARTE
jgi:excisionase family DNA binding protein